MRSNPLLKSADQFLGRGLFAGLRLHQAACGVLSRWWRRSPLGAPDVTCVVAVKLCCLGDGVLAGPALRAVKAQWPTAHLVVLCTPRSAAAFAHMPWVDEVIELPVTGHGGMGEVVRNGRHVLPALARLRRLRPQVALDLDIYYKATPVLAYLTGAAVRVGFDTEGYGRGGLFTASVPYDCDRWEADCFLDIVGLLGVRTENKQLEFEVPVEARRRAEELLVAAGIGSEEGVLALCPGSSRNWPAKQWPADRFARVGQWASRDRGMRVVVVGAGFEAELCSRVAAQVGWGAANLAGRTSVPETAAVLQRARLLVTNDTGPMHLASAVGTPVVAIFGPTNERKWGPRGPRDVVVTDEACDCRPCYGISYMPDCAHRRCLLKVSVERVIEAAARVLEGLPD